MFSHAWRSDVGPSPALRVSREGFTAQVQLESPPTSCIAHRILLQDPTSLNHPEARFTLRASFVASVRRSMYAVFPVHPRKGRSGPRFGSLCKGLLLEPGAFTGSNVWLMQYGVRRNSLEDASHNQLDNSRDVDVKRDARRTPFSEDLWLQHV